MATYFTVDRAGTLSTGLLIQLTQTYPSERFHTVNSTPNHNDLIQRINQLYPEGISQHGLKYLTDFFIITSSENPQQGIGAENEPVIEAIFEQVRKAEFPNRPSRMQSMFAWHNLDEARKFRNDHTNSHCKIYKIESERAFTGNLDFLFLGGSVIAAYEFARKYWSEEESDNHSPEAVIPLPVTIGSLIE